MYKVLGFLSLAWACALFACTDSSKTTEPAQDGGTTDASKDGSKDAFGEAAKDAVTQDQGSSGDVSTNDVATGDVATVDAALDVITAPDSAFGSVTKTVSYTEPTTMSGQEACSTGGAAISNLDHTTIYYSVNQGPTVMAATVPKRSPSGGGEVSTKVAFQKATSGTDSAVVWVTASDANGLESDPTCSEKVTISLP